MMRVVVRAVLAGLLLHGVGACGEGSPVQPPAPAAVRLLDGGGQAALAFEAVPQPLRVSVTDRGGKPMAGVLVSWSASAGTLSAGQTPTDASGVAAVSWTFSNAGSTVFPLGTHQVNATVAGLPAVVFTGHARRGVELESVAVSPEQVIVTSWATGVSVTVRATDDIGSVSQGSFRFVSPSGQSTPYTPLTLASGTGTDGVWQGTVQIPPNAEAGAWKLEITLRSGRGNHAWHAPTLELRGFPSRVTVMPPL